MNKSLRLDTTLLNSASIDKLNIFSQKNNTAFKLDSSLNVVIDLDTRTKKREIVLKNDVVEQLNNSIVRETLRSFNIDII